MIVVWLFLAVPWVCLHFVIVEFPNHTNLLFLTLRDLDRLQSLKQFFINVSYHTLVASLTLMALKTEPSELDWLQVYDMTH